MSQDSLGRRLERGYIRPFFHWLKRPFKGRPSAGSTQLQARLQFLEARVDQLESLIREDLGLRYLGLDGKTGQDSDPR